MTSYSRSHPQSSVTILQAWETNGVSNEALSKKGHHVLELRNPGDWNIKVFEITSPFRDLEKTLIEAARLNQKV
jgi:hypothetical protein